MPRKPSPAAAEIKIDPLFAPIVAAFTGDAAVTLARMFSSSGVLKVDGRVFCMVVKGKFVAKLPKDKVDTLVASGSGEYFDPGHGRLMKEWIAMEVKTKRAWLGLAREAREYVGQSSAKK